MNRLITLLALLLLALPALAQETPVVSPALAAFSKSAMQHAHPAVTAWIASQSASATRSALDPQTLASTVRNGAARRFNGQKIGDAEIETLVVLVMHEQMRQMIDDMKALLEELQAAREEKESLRDLLAEVNAALDSARDRKSSSRCTLAVCRKIRPRLDAVLALQKKAGRQTSFVPREPSTLAELRTAAKQIEEARDSLSELGEERQLRMQTIMERMTKADQMASNLLKKLSNASERIISNLK